MSNCVVCRADVPDGKICPRCGQDNTSFQSGGGFIDYFGSIWGVLSLLLILPPLFMMMPLIYPAVDNALQPLASVRVGAPIAFLISFIVAFYMYSLRIAIHHYSLTRHFKAQPGRSVAMWALIFFVSAVLLIFFLAFALTSKSSLIAPPGYYPQEGDGLLRYGSFGHLLLKLILTGFLIFIFAFLSLSAGMMAAYVFGHKMESKYPSPIYLNETRLIDVVLKTVKNQLGPGAKITTAGLKRLENGGISITLACEEPLTTQGNELIQKAKTWTVEADCWGRVNKIEEKGLRLIKSS